MAFLHSNNEGQQCLTWKTSYVDSFPNHPPAPQSQSTSHPDADPAPHTSTPLLRYIQISLQLTYLNYEVVSAAESEVEGYLAVACRVIEPAWLGERMIVALAVQNGPRTLWCCCCLLRLQPKRWTA